MNDSISSRKSQISSKKVSGNVHKYEAYREAWSRIKAAQENKFFLEAITIQESIITDRLKRFLTLSDSINPLEEKQAHNRHLSFYELIKAWQKNFPNGLQTKEYTDLIDATNIWRVERNRAIHAIIKPSYHEKNQTIDDFLDQANETAEEGTRLAREICKWCEKEKKQDKFAK